MNILTWSITSIIKEVYVIKHVYVAHLDTCKKLCALFNVSYDPMSFQRSFYQEFSNDDDDEAEEEKADDLHELMTADRQYF